MIERLNYTYGVSLVKPYSDLDTSSSPCTQIELVDSNPIHIIQIPLFVTRLYTVGINEVYTVIILINSCLFPVTFGL